MSGVAPPSLILVMGVAGSGKTTLSKELVRRLSIPYLDNNFIADAFFPDTRCGPEYLRLRPGLYRALYAIAEGNLALGNSILLDVPHVKEVRAAAWRDFITRLAARTGSRLVVIKCVCSNESLRARLEARGEPRDRWKLDHWQQFLEAQPIDVSVPFRHLTVNTEQRLSDNVSVVTDHILDC